MGFSPDWVIDRSNQGPYFLKFTQNGNSHTSDGLGEGIVSVFAIVDALYDSSPGEMVVIDEPELSLHPSLQKRVSSLLAELSRDRQIVVSTHSPYFVDLEALAAGAHLVRVASHAASGTKVFGLSEDSKRSIANLATGNLYNPHIFGINAREIFFQEDGVILTEGQEDVLLYPELAKQLDRQLPASFFGWGIGGAGNMKLVAAIMHDLGFQRVAGLLDGDQESALGELRLRFPRYKFEVIPAKDIRTKPARPGSSAVTGLLDEALRLRDEYKAQMVAILASLDDYFRTGS